MEELKNVNEEIKALLKEKTKLKKKKLSSQLTDEEGVELDGVEELLKELENQRDGYIKIALKEEPEVQSKTFRNAEPAWIESVTGVSSMYDDWNITGLEESVFPSPKFKEIFTEVCDVFHMRKEAGRRLILNIFLTDVLARSEFKKQLKVFPELSMEVVRTVNNKKRRINGDADYTIGLRKGKSIFDKSPPTELHLIALEAKTAYEEDDFWQCVAEMATIFRSRKDAGKRRCSVWGVLSNALDWIFIYIDEQGNLMRAKKVSLDLPKYDEDEIMAVYRRLYYIVKCCFEAVTPTTTPASSSAALME